MTSNKSKLFLFAAAAFGFGLSAAYAQQQPPAQPPAEDESSNEIVVFAQKREQNLQDVPVSVSVLNSAILEDAGVTDIKELTVLTPGLLVTSTTNESVTTARIRGIGTVGDNPGLESSVGVVIDGVYRPRNGVGFGDLGEIERIEVLKGPQGTLFGKNTSAGVIQVFSAKPEFKWGGSAEVTAGDFNKLGASASLTGPLIEDKLAFRIFGTTQNRDGLLNAETGLGLNTLSTRTLREDNNQNYSSIRGQLLFTPSPDFDFRLIADFSERDEDCCLAVALRSPNPNAALANQTQALINSLAGGVATLSPVDPFRRTAFGNRPTDQQIEDKGIQGEANWDFGWGTFTSVTAWRQWEINTATDIDFTALDIVWRSEDDQGREFRQFSQEFRLAGDSFDGKFNWLLGVFYADEDVTTREATVLGRDYARYVSALLGGAQALAGITSTNALQLGGGQRDVYRQDGTSYAIFTNNSFAVTDALELTLGLRFTHDEKDVEAQYNTTSPSCQIALSNQASLISALGGGSTGVARAGGVLGALCLPWLNSQFSGASPNQSREEDEWSGTVKAAYRWNPNILTYVSAARGYKAGGFNLDREQVFGFNGTAFQVIRDDNTAFEGEFVDSYEIGVKTNWFGNDVILNLTAFAQDYENFQLNSFVGTNFVVTSIPEVESRGAEVDFLWQTPLDGLSIQGGVAYAKTEFGDKAPVVPTLVAGQGVQNLPNPAFALLPGNQVGFAPEWTVSGSFAYERDIMADKLRFRASLNGKWTDEYNTASDLLPAKQQDAFALFNGRIAIGAPSERWTLELWGQNLTDEEYIQVGFNTPLQGSATSAPSGAPRPALVTGGSPVYDPNFDTITYSAFLGAPRTVGATLRVKW